MHAPPGLAAHRGRQASLRGRQASQPDRLTGPARLARALGVALVLALTGALAVAAPAAAHAELDTASPAVDATVDVPPTSVSATFTEALVPDKSSFELRLDGEAIAEGGVDPNDPTTLRLEVAPLAPGRYVVRWTAATDDGHIERGRYEFTVVEAASPEPSQGASVGPGPTPSASPTPASTVGTTPAPSPSAGPEAGDGSGGSESLGQIIAIALVGIGLGLGIGWWRSRQAA